MDRLPTPVFIGFPGGSAGKEYACNMGDLGSVPGLGRSLRASLVVQLVKNAPAIRSMGWEDPLEEGMTNHSSILAWRIPWTEQPGGLQSMGSQRVRNS